MSNPRLLDLSSEQQERERRQADQEQADQDAFEHRRGRVLWQCVALTFTGVPLYVWSWSLTDGRQSELAASFALVLSYVAPFFRWLAYHIRESEEFR